MENGGRSDAAYAIPSETNLKQYYIKGEYTDEHLGTGKVIAPLEGTSGNERFYVMALEDINTEVYFWYYAARGKLDKIVAFSENDFGQGRENTEYVNGKWNDPTFPWGEHNEISNVDDMWEAIQEEIVEGWFVPSKSEWAAFGAAFDIIRNNSASTYGLSNYYWTSSQYDEDEAYRMDVIGPDVNTGYVNSTLNYVRLATTF